MPVSYTHLGNFYDQPKNDNAEMDELVERIASLESELESERGKASSCLLYTSTTLSMTDKERMDVVERYQYLSFMFPYSPMMRSRSFFFFARR